MNQGNTFVVGVFFFYWQIKIFHSDFGFVSSLFLFLIKSVFLNILANKIIGLETFSLNL